MNSSRFMSATKKSTNYLPDNIDNITAARFIFYIICIAILLELGLKTDSINTISMGEVLTPLLYFAMGVIAATIANSTGAGGGIVFLPIFMGLGFTPLESLSTSIAIQCFGMSSGSLAWISFRKCEQSQFSKQWQYFPWLLIVSSTASCLGVITTQRWSPNPPINIEFLFALFSLIIGSVILIRTLKVKIEQDGRTTALSAFETISLVLLSFIGGAITAWISIGVGELLLILLIFLGFRLNVAVACSVCVSAVSVLIAIPFHIATQSVSLDVLIYAAPGALIGGIIARILATTLGAHKLKTAAASWIILSSTPYLITSLT